MRAAQGRAPPRRARSMAHVAPIIAQPFARPAAHGRPPPGQCLRNRAWDRSNNRPASMREGSAQRWPSSAQRLALDKASDRLPCAASTQVARTHIRQSGPRPEGRLLRQPTLEGLTRSARTDSPRKTDRSKSDQSTAAAAARGKHGGGGEACMERGGRELSLGLGLMCVKSYD
ncbi:hypothetical protein F511_28760 [Dorcoceras hygrometricum]|uniref:Uncharacterized protein n=1 Tax=Dorcoceras hygrometricum TaxID=472368 RepID=A0A2Z7CLG4_9LAMI|nr:hypothetical protein F511_28760 [Dorcoceras hygrometricum]